MPRDGDKEKLMLDDSSDVFSLDLETFYSRDYSLKNTPTWAYVYSPLFDAYLVSVAGPNGYLWVGHPSKFDWSVLDGKTIVMHNASFDALCLKRMVEDKTISHFSPGAVHCTADMAAYLKWPRALKDIARFVFGQKDLAVAGKQAREKMKGMRADELSDDPEILKYAANDALLCRRAWLEGSELWPEEEREISRIGREDGWRGVKVDLPYVDDCIDRLGQRLFAAERSIPWKWEQGKTPLARNKMIAEAQGALIEERLLTLDEGRALEAALAPGDAGILGLPANVVSEVLHELWSRPEDIRKHPCELHQADDRQILLKKFMWFPASFAKDDPECEAWENDYADRFEWIKAVRDWRRHNMLLQKFRHLREFTDADGRYRVQLRYCGAHTGRWSGSGFFNVQNLPRKEMFCDKDAEGKDIPGTGFDLRRCLVGNFYITDYAQIEARGLVALVRDERILPKLRAGMSIYQAHAEATTGRTWKNLKKENFPLYQAKKMEVLLLGYQGGGKKMASAAYLMTRDGPPDGVIRWTEAEACAIVDGYRKDNPVVGLWRMLDNKVKQSAFLREECMEIKLPSGRVMRYWNPRVRSVSRIVKGDDGQDVVTKRDAVFTQHAKGDPSSYRSAFGGNLTENVVSGMCRDALRDGWLALHRAGYLVAFTAHDEYVVDLQEGQTPEEVDKIVLDANNASWASFIPLALEGARSPCYTK